MPITPPRSGVQLLSPAALLGGQSQRNNGLGQLMNLVIQERSQAFQAAQNEVARKAADDRTIAQLLASGSVVKADDPRAARFGDIPSFEFAGTSLIPQSDIGARVRAEAMAAPITSLGGREFFEGTTAGDIYGADVGGQFGIEGPVGSGGSPAAGRGCGWGRRAASRARSRDPTAPPGSSRRPSRP